MVMVNLLPWRQRDERRRLRLWLLRLGALSGIALLMLVGVYFRYEQQLLEWEQRVAQARQEQQSQEEALRQRLQLWQELQRYQQFDQQFDQRQRQTAAPDANRRYAALLAHLPELLPDAVWLTEIQDNGDALLVSGVSDRYAAIGQFSQALAREAAIGRVSLQRAQRLSADNAALGFVLRLSWRTGGNS